MQSVEWQFKPSAVEPQLSWNLQDHGGVWSDFGEVANSRITRAWSTGCCDPFYVTLRPNRSVKVEPAAFLRDGLALRHAVSDCPTVMLVRPTRPAMILDVDYWKGDDAITRVDVYLLSGVCTLHRSFGSPPSFWCISEILYNERGYGNCCMVTKGMRVHKAMFHKRVDDEIGDISNLEELDCLLPRPKAAAAQKKPAASSANPAASSSSSRPAMKKPASNSSRPAVKKPASKKA